jgi:hypothetical protein
MPVGWPDLFPLLYREEFKRNMFIPMIPDITARFED